MSLVINGRQYPNVAPFIGDLRLLKREFGFGWAEVARRMSGIDDETPLIDLVDDEEFMDAIIAWMWMTRLRAGERDLTRTDVEQTPVDVIEFVDDDEEVVADPQHAPKRGGKKATKASVSNADRPKLEVAG